MSRWGFSMLNVIFKDVQHFLHDILGFTENKKTVS